MTQSSDIGRGDKHPDAGGTSVARSVRRYGLTLSEEEFTELKRLGNGTASAGIRLLIDEHRNLDLFIRFARRANLDLDVIGSTLERDNSSP